MKIGDKFWRLTVVATALPSTHRGERRWLFRCECGIECVLEEYRVLQGAVKSCGCLRTELLRERNKARTKLHVKTGDKFGRLTAKQQVGESNSTWLFSCECGNEVQVNLSKVFGGHTQSCGCYRKERTATVHTKHGKTRSRAYIVWAGMMQRCYNLQCKAYASYGGRGITVAPEWHDFCNFYRDMGDPPQELQIDRIDNTQGYGKSNCRWCSRRENSNNRRDNIRITVGPNTKTLSEWARHFGISINTVKTRYRRGVRDSALFCSTKPNHELKP